MSTGPRQPVPACQSCRQFALDRLLYPKHAALGLGHCALDGQRSKFRFMKFCCPKYQPTARRAAYLAAMAILHPNEA
jgi:hypothetical protein